MNIAHLGQELNDLIAGGTMAKCSRSSGSERVNVREVLFKGEAIKEEQGVEGLILGAGRDPRESEAGQKSLDFKFGGFEGFWVWGCEECRIAFEPLGIGFLGVECEVF